MKKYIKLGVIFLFIIQVLCGCKANSVQESNEKIDVVQQHKVSKIPYLGYFQKEIELSTYEPIHGTYLGAYVLANPEIEFDITRFEQAVGKDMAVALRHYQMGDPFPDKWLLQCLANKKAPHMVIAPQNMDLPYDKESLIETAKKFENTFGIPVFIEFYPGAKDFGDPVNYISYFQLAKETFARHAPNVAFVWSMNMEDVYDSMVYYPGDDYVDWIGISMYFPIYKDNEKYTVQIEEKLDYFYNMYQDKKPMMISSLGISHYSNKDHTFYVDEAINNINQIYSQIPIRYPRIKGINYIDIDNIKIAPNKKGNDNFRVSTEPKITKAYKKAIKDPYYLQNIVESPKQTTDQWIEMRTPIYEWDNKLYIGEETITYDWNLDIIDEIKDYKVIIGGNEYYDLKQVAQSMDYKYTLNEDIIKFYR